MHRLLRSLLPPVVLILAIACSSGDPTTGLTVSPSPSPNDVDIVPGAQSKGSAAFDPNPKSLSLNGAQTATVRWVNLDVSSGYGTTGVTHRIVSDDGTSFDTGNLGENETSTKTLAVGTYHYHCTIHPTMIGTLVVSP